MTEKKTLTLSAEALSRPAEMLNEVLGLHGGCHIIHSNYPKDFTCLDKQEDAADPAARYGESYRADILSGVYLCHPCRVRAMLTRGVARKLAATPTTENV